MESNSVGVFLETATANVEPVFADDADARGAGAAAARALAVSLRMRSPDVFVSHVEQRWMAELGKTSET